MHYLRKISVRFMQTIRTIYTIPTQNVRITYAKFPQDYQTSRQALQSTYSNKFLNYWPQVWNRKTRPRPRVPLSSGSNRVFLLHRCYPPVAFWVVDDPPELSLFGNEVTTATMMMMMMTMITTIRISHILQFCHQYLRLRRVAVFSNWRAPSWRASARESRSVSFWSRSSTFSTFTLIMSTTSSTCAWVCCSLLLGCPPLGWAPLGCGGGAEGPAVAIFWFCSAIKKQPRSRKLWVRNFYRNFGVT